MLSLRRSLLRRYRLHAPQIFRRGWLLLLVLLLCDGITALCFPQIQAALSLSTPAHNSGGTSNVGVVAPTIAPMASESMLANDTFQRTNQVYWGVSSNGETWQGEARTAENFHIINHVGIIDPITTHTVQNAILGPEGTNIEMTFTGSLSHYNGTSTLGAVLHWSDADNFYTVYLDGQNLHLVRVVDSMVMPLTMVPYPAQDGASYTFRFRTIGAQLCAMVWPSGQPAPSTWQISLSDSALGSGHAGISVLALNDAQAKITAFTEVAL
jgi:hypothetical protein